MPADRWFEITESHAFTGRFSWRLKETHLHFQGVDSSDNPLPVVAPIVVRKEQLAHFSTTLDYLEACQWDSEYNALELGWKVYDGMSWTFSGVIDGQEYKTGGINAFPSFADPTKASLDQERYAFLVFSLRSIFEIETPKNWQQKPLWPK